MQDTMRLNGRKPFDEGENGHPFFCHRVGEDQGNLQKHLHWVRTRPKRALGTNNSLIFFGWRLLGYVPGGAPFSQLNKGVKDAMAISTK